ncbi:hypothetical protein JW859_13245 [bacterium]|nr:hypothetical protein [bacterium]
MRCKSFVVIIFVIAAVLPILAACGGGNSTPTRHISYYDDYYGQKRCCFAGKIYLDGLARPSGELFVSGMGPLGDGEYITEEGPMLVWEVSGGLLYLDLDYAMQQPFYYGYEAAGEGTQSIELPLGYHVRWALPGDSEEQWIRVRQKEDAFEVKTDWAETRWVDLSRTPYYYRQLSSFVAIARGCARCKSGQTRAYWEYD